MEIIKRIGVSLAHIALATITSMSVCGALFVIPALNGGDPSLLWSVIGIVSAFAWGALNLFTLVSEEFPPPLALAFAISACMHFLAIGTLAVLQGFLLVIMLLAFAFGNLPPLGGELVLMISNCVMLVVLVCAAAVIVSNA